MNTRRTPAFDVEPEDLPVDDWTLDEFDAIDDPAEIGTAWRGADALEEAF